MKTWFENPFSNQDSDRYQIWEILVHRDTDAFLAADWGQTADDFTEGPFLGYSGCKSQNPDHWRIEFPTLEKYREEWLLQARDFQSVRLRADDPRDFLFRTTTLRDIEIQGDHAVAHKKFDGATETVDGKPIHLNWQTLYFLRREKTKWKIAGFVGYIPNPMGGASDQTSSSREIVSGIPNMPAPSGPYSFGVISRGKLLHVSGQGPYNPKTQKYERGSIAEQTRLTLEGVQRIVIAAEGKMENVVSCRVFLHSLNEQTFQEMNGVYREFFPKNPPARTTVGAQLLNIDVEIDCVVSLN